MDSRQIRLCCQANVLAPQMCYRVMAHAGLTAMSVPLAGFLRTSELAKAQIAKVKAVHASTLMHEACCWRRMQQSAIRFIRRVACTCRLGTAATTAGL